MKKENPAEKIIVALDTQDLNKAKKIVKKLHKIIPHFKIGSELFTAHGPEAVKALRWVGGHIFLDLKFHDIPNTVAGAVRSATALNVFMMTIHTIGGSEMMQAARKAAEEVARSKKLKRRPKLLGVTVLTSINQEVLKKEIGIDDSVDKTVLRYAEMAEHAGMDGVVCSGRELAKIRSKLDQDMLVVVPGIRPAWSVPGDQERIMTPQKALALGADYLVIGRPITAARDQKEAAERVIDEIKAAISS